MRHRRKIVIWIAVPLALLVLGFVLPHHIIYDWDNRLFCHKQMTLAVRVWQNDKKPSSAYPNVDGDSLRSMNAMAEALRVATNQVFRDYRCVPGLEEGDSPELVMFYFNRPTRWRWHGRPEAKWKPKTWVVVPIDVFPANMDQSRNRIGSGPNQILSYGEVSESLTTEQFTNRVIATLEFLRTNNRPHWQAVVKEHTTFLESISQNR